jgi:hypothetical protein
VKLNIYYNGSLRIDEKIDKSKNNFVRIRDVKNVNRENSSDAIDGLMVG